MVINPGGRSRRVCAMCTGVMQVSKDGELKTLLVYQEWLWERKEITKHGNFPVVVLRGSDRVCLPSAILAPAHVVHYCHRAPYGNGLGLACGPCTIRENDRTHAADNPQYIVNIHYVPSMEALFPIFRSSF
jgi:hypothetical protein